MSDNEVNCTKEKRIKNEELTHQKLFEEIKNAEVSL